MNPFLLSIWCVDRQFIYAVDSIRSLSLSFQWWFQCLQRLSFRLQFVYQQRHSFWQFHASAMNLILLPIWWIDHQFIYAVDSIRPLSLRFQWRFQCLQRLSFRWWFGYQQWHSVFDNSMRQPWLYFWYRFDASSVNSLTMSITYVGCYSVFIDDFKVYSCSVFAGNLWISHYIAFLTIPCVNHDSIFAIDLMHRSWIHWHCRLYTSAVT